MSARLTPALNPLTELGGESVLGKHADSSSARLEEQVGATREQARGEDDGRVGTEDVSEAAGGVVGLAQEGAECRSVAAFHSAIPFSSRETNRVRYRWVRRLRDRRRRERAHYQ